MQFRQEDNKSLTIYSMEPLLVIFMLVLMWTNYQQTLTDRALERLVRMRQLNTVLIYACRRRRSAIRRSCHRRRQAIMRAYHDVVSFGVRARPLRSLWVHPRTCQWWQDVSETWTDRQWLQNFRMKRGTFMHLCDLLRPSLSRSNTQYRQPVPVELRVAITLWKLATNLEFRSLSHLFGVGKSTACMITQEVITTINNTMSQNYIKPPSATELRATTQAFRDKWHFPQVAGAIDGTHIGILAPRDTPADYFNRKGFFSVLLQGVVDHRMMFWDVNIGYSGKVHDARMFANSSLYRRGQAGTLLPGWTETFEGVDVPLVLLGDSAYPLLPWLMKPFPEGRGITPEQIQFNHRLSQARMTVERAFGRLKGRWRCLLKRNDTHITFVSRLIMACCVLHNFCELRNEYFDEEQAVFGRVGEGDDGGGDDDAAQRNQANAGREIRNALCAYFSTV